MNLEEIISAAQKGIIFPDQFKNWEKFKGTWSEEDKVYWNNLYNRLEKDPAGKLYLKAPLDAEEKIWAHGFIERAKDAGFY
jgi:hypothetical protein